MLATEAKKEFREKEVRGVAVAFNQAASGIAERDILFAKGDIGQSSTGEMLTGKYLVIKITEDEHLAVRNENTKSCKWAAKGETTLARIMKARAARGMS